MKRIEYKRPRYALGALLINMARLHQLRSPEFARVLGIPYHKMTKILYQRKSISVETFFDLAEGMCSLNKMPITYNMTQLYNAIKKGKNDDEKTFRYKANRICRP